MSLTFFVITVYLDHTRYFLCQGPLNFVLVKAIYSFCSSQVDLPYKKAATSW